MTCIGLGLRTFVAGSMIQAAQAKPMSAMPSSVFGPGVSQSSTLIAAGAEVGYLSADVADLPPCLGLVVGGADEVARLTHVVDVAENDAGSALGETRSNGLADATAGPSHQRNPSGVRFRGPVWRHGPALV